MNNNRLGCLSPLAIFSAFITLAIIIAAEVLSGNSMFTAGLLNIKSGPTLNGVASHAEIGKDCAQCHAAPWSRETMSQRCAACHQAIRMEMVDAATLHGAIAARNPAAECRACHPEHRGPNASLTLMDEGDFPHEVVGFALTAHQTRSNSIPFTCGDCHGEDITSFNQQTCTDCHRQLDTVFTTAHAIEFGSDCLACHDGVDRYGHFDHSQGTFKLTGKHIGVVCSKCHLNARTMSDLQNTATACESCHLKNDAHAGRFGTSCGVCHSPTGWEPAKFDHNLAAFKLEDEHAEVKCEECHRNEQYQGTPKDCYACHRNDDEHNGKYGTQCENCHNPKSWEDAAFDHSLSKFPLTGSHINVACEECHKDNTFQGTSTSCAACHGEPSYHAGMFSRQECSECHSTSAWRPARYDGPHTFPMNHGEKNNTCADCHQPTLTTWTCYTCHDQGETAAEHREEGISNFDNCLECHPTGQEGEGGGD